MKRFTEHLPEYQEERSHSKPYIISCFSSQSQTIQMFPICMGENMLCKLGELCAKAIQIFFGTCGKQNCQLLKNLLGAIEFDDGKFCRSSML